MDDITKLKADLEQAGFSFSKQPFDTGVDWYAWKPMRSAVDCTYNGPAPVMMIEPYDLSRLVQTYRANHHFNGNRPQVEFTVFGDLPSGRAAKFKEYSVEARSVMEVLDAVEHTLCVAWSAAVAADEGGKQ